MNSPAPHKDGEKKHVFKQHFSHFYTVFSYISHFVYLLIIPLIQYFLYSPRSATEVITNVGINILFVIIILTLAILEYRSIRYSTTKDSLLFQRGQIIRRTVRFPYKYIQGISIQKDIIPSIVDAIKIKIFMPAFFRRKSELSLTLSTPQTSQILNSIFSANKTKLIYKDKILGIILMALSWSNSITGLIIFIPFLNHVGTVLGEHFTDMFLSGVDRFSFSTYVASVGISPLISSLSLLLLVGFVVAFVVQIFRYGRFSVTQTDDQMIISRGILSRNTFITEVRNINSFTVRQNLLMLLFGLSSVYIKTIGSGKTKGDKSLLFPARKHSKTIWCLRKFHNASIKSHNIIKPKRNALIGYMAPPVIILLATAIAFPFFRRFGISGQIVRISLVIVACVCVAWCWLRYTAMKKSCFGFSHEGIMMTCFSGFNISTELIPFEKIQYVTIIQSIIQKKAGTCHINVHFYSEKKEHFTVRHVNFEEAANSLKEITQLIPQKRCFT